MALREFEADAIKTIMLAEAKKTKFDSQSGKQRCFSFKFL
jgi:hypothetical protein